MAGASAIGPPGGARPGRWGGMVVGLTAAALFVVGAAWTLAQQVTGSQGGAAGMLGRSGLIATVVLMGASLAALLAVGGVRAVARHTVAQCARMKVAGVFILLLGGALVGLPFVMEGDGTLAGRIRTLLSYGTVATGVLLSLLTIFLAAGVVNSDVRTKSVFIVATKPLARWQYVLGRWLGLVAFNAALLLVASVITYAFAQYLRGRADLALNPNDPTSVAGDLRTVETEIFSARRKVLPVAPDLGPAVAERIEELKRDGRYAETMAAYRIRAGGDNAEARRMLERIVRKQVAAGMNSAGPLGSLIWMFEGIDVAESRFATTSEVMEVNREARLFRIRAGSRLLGRLVFRGPVRVNDVRGRVERLGAGFFDVSFDVEEMQRGEIRHLDAGEPVNMLVDPFIQITYTATPARAPSDSTLHSVWLVNNPGGTGFAHQEIRADRAHMPATLTVSARAVDDRGRTRVRYINLPHRISGFRTSVTVLRSDVAVLYRVGDFEDNYFRGILLMLIQLAFLAALGVFAGSFCTFPVACMLCFISLPFSMIREFLKEAVSLPYSVTGAMDAITTMGHYVTKLMTLLLPDYAETSPGDLFVKGMEISWTEIGRVSALAVAVQTLVVLAAACVIFGRRELARVQA